MADYLTKLMTSLNISIYRLSNGRLGNKLGRQSVLLLHNDGRKSGKKYTTSLSYYRDGKNYLVVASNWGKESLPDWYYNIMSQPHTTVQVGTEKIEVVAHLVEQDDFQRLWQLVTDKNDQYIKYQTKMKRRIPIIVLEPVNHNYEQKGLSQP